MSRRNEQSFGESKEPTRKREMIWLKSEDDDVENIVDWETVGRELQNVDRSESLEAHLLQIPSNSSQPSAERKQATWAFDTRLNLALVAAMVLALFGISASVWWINSKGRPIQAKGTETRDFDDAKENSAGETQTETEHANQNSLAANQQEKELEEVRAELAEIALQIQIAEQVLAKLETQEEFPIVPGRYQVASQRKRVSTRESLAAALVLSANYEVERSATSAASHPNYEYVVQLFPDSRWSSIASERMSSPD